MKLAACNGKRIKDMTRADMIKALEQMNNSYRAIARLQMGEQLRGCRWVMSCRCSTGQWKKQIDGLLKSRRAQ